MSLNYSSEDLFVINTGVNNGQADINEPNYFADAGVHGIKLGDYSHNSSGQVVKDDNFDTISQTSGLAVSGVSNVDGYLAIDLGTTPPILASCSISIFDADYPLNKTYQALMISGNYVITTDPELSCIPSNVGNYTVSSGVLDQEVYDLPAAFVGGDFCTLPNGSTKNRKFEGYTSRTYAECWQCFGGRVDPCNIVVSGVTLWDDQALTADRVQFFDVCRVVAGDPLTSGDGEGVPGDDNPEDQNFPPE